MLLLCRCEWGKSFALKGTSNNCRSWESRRSLGLTAQNRNENKAESFVGKFGAPDDRWQLFEVPYSLCVLPTHTGGGVRQRPTQTGQTAARSPDCSSFRGSARAADLRAQEVYGLRRFDSLGARKSHAQEPAHHVGCPGGRDRICCEAQRARRRRCTSGHARVRRKSWGWWQ